MRNRKKKELCFFVLYGVVLVFLFLASSTDLIIKERENPVYPVSVIIGDSSDDDYVNFRKGMDRAALELNADISFVSLYERNDAAQQTEMVLREQREGAKAIVLAPVKNGQLDSLFEWGQMEAPVILTGASMDGHKAYCAVAADYEAMGKRLGQEILAHHGNDQTVWLLEQGRGNWMNRQFEAGIQAALSEADCQAAYYNTGEDPDLGSFFFTRKKRGEEDLVIACLDQESLLAAADHLAGSQAVRSNPVAGLYGRGTSVSLLNHLDQGRITGICVTDDFTAGYISIQTAVEAASGKKKEEDVLLESWYIERQDLRDPVFEKMLYPIE